MSNVSDNIKRYRTKKGLTQAELGKMIGKAPSVIGNWEAQTNRPDVDSIEKMLAIFDVDANTFFGWTDRQLSSPGISRETGRYVNQTTPTQLERLTTYLKEDDKELTLDVLIDILKSMPEKLYSEIKDNLMVIKFKYHLKEGE